jgi:hypothetical protein
MYLYVYEYLYVYIRWFYVDSANEDILNEKMPNEDISKNKKMLIYWTKNAKSWYIEKKKNLT